VEQSSSIITAFDGFTSTFLQDTFVVGGIVMMIGIKRIELRKFVFFLIRIGFFGDVPSSDKRWIEAGPVVVIITCLTLIFTIGLSDGNENKGGLSAYSVFNRGFERLLGSVDADALLAQHVGGGLGGGAGIMMMNNQNNHHHNHNIDRADAHGAAVARRQEPNIQDHHEDELAENDSDNGDDGGEIDQSNNTNQSRKSGKKARRRNLEQRRDQRRQREIAMQMELDGDGRPEDVMAMQRLIEDQIAAEINRR
jgi:hypothetical protein